MASVKLSDKPLVSAAVEGDHLVLIRDGAVKRLPLELLAAAEDLDSLTEEVKAYVRQIIAGAASAKVHLYDIGSASFDPTALDFSVYGAGDVVLVVQDMGGGEA